MSRRLRIVLGVLLVLVLVVVGGLYYVTHHYNAAPQVKAKVEQMFGGRVEINTANVGLGESTLQGLKLYEGKEHTEKPWLQAEQVQADASILELLKGLMPHRLTLHDVALTLRFDEKGHLLTQLPSMSSGEASVPEVVVDNATLTIEQEGRPAFILRNANLTLNQKDASYNVGGGAKDPEWGDWDLTATAASDLESATATIKTASAVRFTQPMLDRLPFISSAVWKQLQCDGETTGEITLKVNRTDNQFHLRVALEPTLERVYIPSVDLRTTATKGKVIVDDFVVKFIDMDAHVADGTALAGADMDFTKPPYRLKFDVRVKNLDVQKLPKSWELPPEIGGKLVGHADLTVVINDGAVQANGKGEGVINNATLAGIPAEPITLRLHPAGKGYRFQTEKKSSALPQPSGGDRVAARKPKAGVRFQPVSRRLEIPVAAPELLLAQEPPTTTGGRFVPTRVINGVLGGTTRALNQVIDSGAKAVGRLPTTAPTPPGEQTSYVDVNLNLRDADVAQLVERLKLQLPFTVTGRLTLHVKVSLPLTGIRDMRTYRVEGEVSSPRLTVEGTDLDRLEVRLRYRDGIARLDRLTGEIPRAKAGARPGTFSGSARFPFIPRGDLSLHVQFDDIDVPDALRSIPALATNTQGAVSGVLDGTVRGGDLGDPQAWDITGSARSPAIKAYGAELRDFAGELRFEKSILKTRIVRGVLEGGAISGTAQVSATAPYRYEAHLGIRDLLLSRLKELNPGFRPPLPLGGTAALHADATGTLSPFTFKASGTGNGAGVEAAGATVKEATFTWDLDPDRLRISKLDGELYGGKIAGTAQVPLQANAAGTLDLRFSDVDTAGLSRDLHGLPLRLSGEASGSLKASLPAAAAGQARNADLALELTAPRLTIQGIPAERLTGNATYKDRALEYHFKGDTLGGDFSLDGKMPAPPAKPAPGEPEGRLRVRRARLARLWDAWHVERTVGPLNGIISVDLEFNHTGPGGEPVGSGQINLAGLRWDETRLSTGNITVALRLTPEELRLENLSGIVAQGILRGRMTYNLRFPDRSFFVLDVDHIDLPRVLAPWPRLATDSQGAIDMHIAGRVAPILSANVTAALSRGRLAGFDIGDVRIPLRVAFSPQSGSAEAATHDASFVLAGGRVSLRFTYRGGFSSRIEGNAQFYNVDLPMLFRQFSDISSYGTGKLTGRVEFQGNDVRSLNDLTATIDANLSQTQAFQFPVLSQMPLFLPTAASGSSLFQTGSVRGTLDHGVFRLQRLELVGSLLQLIVEGTVNLSGVLNLEVTANTGMLSANQAGLRLLRVQLPSTGAAPLGLLTSATNYLSGRVIHLRIRGTIRNPLIQVEPLGLVTQEALVFFLTRAWLGPTGFLIP